MLCNADWSITLLHYVMHAMSWSRALCLCPVGVEADCDSAHATHWPHAVVLCVHCYGLVQWTDCYTYFIGLASIGAAPVVDALYLRLTNQQGINAHLF